MSTTPSNTPAIITASATFIGIDFHKRYSIWHAIDAAGNDERPRSLLKAGAIVLLPEPSAVCCEACGCAMTFLHATRLRHRARPPPAAILVP